MNIEKKSEEFKEETGGWNCKNKIDEKFLEALESENWKDAEELVNKGANINMYLESGVTSRGYYGYYEDYEFGELDDMGMPPAPTHYVAVNSFLASHGGKFETDESKKQTETSNNNKEHEELNRSILAKVRNKVAKKIDSVLGTTLEEKNITKPLKKIEKAVSDKLFGKVKE